MHITLSIDRDVVRKVRKVAIDKDTTLTAMVRDYLNWVAMGDILERQRRVALLDDSFQRLSRDMGARNWNREDLHAR